MKPFHTFVVSSRIYFSTLQIAKYSEFFSKLHTQIPLLAIQPHFEYHHLCNCYQKCNSLAESLECQAKCLVVLNYGLLHFEFISC